MEEIKEYLLDRYKDFWYDIYYIEKQEIKWLKTYIDYISNVLKEFKPLNCSYESISALFIKKHLDYLQEAFSSIILKNYNAFSGIMRIMIENYISFYLIKKYKKEELYMDWYLWSYYILIYKMQDEPFHSKIKKNYEDLCKYLGVTADYIDNRQAYGWLKRVCKLKNYSFKNVCDLVDSNIYKDFSYLSMKVHNTDMNAKTDWIDMTLLTKFIFIIYQYSEKIIKEYKPSIIRRSKYNAIATKLLESLDNCCNFKEC